MSAYFPDVPKIRYDSPDSTDPFGPGTAGT